MTRDGVQVRLLAHAQRRISDPRRSTAAGPDALGATADVLEASLTREVSR
jgi:hypothetical protein